MVRAKNSLGTFTRIYQEYDNKNFGFASRNFYAEFLAAREIAKNYRAYFPNLRLDDPVRIRTFTVNRAAGIKVLSRHLKVDDATLAALNPALMEPVWSGGRYVPKGYRLNLPPGGGRQGCHRGTPPRPFTTTPGRAEDAPRPSSQARGDHQCHRPPLRGHPPLLAGQQSTRPARGDHRRSAVENSDL